VTSWTCHQVNGYEKNFKEGNMSNILKKLTNSLLIVLLCAYFVFPNLVCAYTVDAEKRYHW